MNLYPLTCVICGAGFMVRRYRIATAKTCSAACRQKYNSRKRDNSKQRYTGEGKTYVKLRGRHMHRVIAEVILGRPLRRGEVVHHKDGNRRNNCPSNLEIVASQGEHMEHHRAQMLAARKAKHGY